MSVAVKGNASTVREEVLFLHHLDANSSAEDFDKMRSQTRSFSSFWEKGCGASLLRTTFSSSSSGTLMSGSSPKTGTRTRC